MNITANNINIKPLYDKILVKTEESKEEVRNGLILTGNDKSMNTLIGTVIAIGNGGINIDGSLRQLTVKPGDIIFFDKYAGKEIIITNSDGVKEVYKLMPETDIIAVAVQTV